MRLFQDDRRTSGSSDIDLPINSSSLHSNITRLTRGSLSAASGSWVNLVNINGSVFPPHDLRLYIPEHRWRWASSCFYNKERQISHNHHSTTERAHQFDFIRQHTPCQKGRQTQRLKPAFHREYQLGPRISNATGLLTTRNHMKAIARSTIKETRYNQFFRNSSNVDTCPGQ